MITVEAAEGGGHLLRCECGWQIIYRSHAVRPETLSDKAKQHRYEEHAFDYARTNWRK